ncbi:flagellar motor switch protein FliM [Blastomonas aquatica]|uniref:Flagellar motor switch protein FliM n=1 Tax=Blastomonas aquatica TaxID=1510276 RepID=A0ABQ1ITW1_9SPHN|nr:FliM/FliN family flagellar motor switch protein [Blastomonas aquatica]GGB52313.1 flagellar motor switch protein FliM [Blastomonas aquatica]
MSKAKSTASQAAEKPDDTAAPAGERRPAEHSFTRADADQKTVVPVLRRVARVLCVGLRNALEPIAGVKLRVDAPDPEFTQFDMWCDKQPELVSISQFQLSPMKGRVLLRMEPAMISAMLDAFFGGAPRESTVTKKEFTQTDIRLIGRMAKVIGERIGSAWNEVGSFACHAVGHASSIDGARIAAPTARMVLQRFRLTLPGNSRYEIEIVYPLEGLQGADQCLTPAAFAEERGPDPAWRDQMATVLADVSLPARSVLARPVLTLPQLADLKPGDIIPIPPARNLPLIIGDRVFARGSLGEQNGLAAFRIETIEKG